MEKALVAGKQPKPVKVSKGQKYFWCACGRSSNQPFCDGSHKGTGLFPVSWEADADKEVWFCMCKQTKNPPFCDGSHKNVSE
jgi:CDGSH-type Zn-finger protein